MPLASSFSGHHHLSPRNPLETLEVKGHVWYKGALVFGAVCGLNQPEMWRNSQDGLWQIAVRFCRLA